MKKFFILISLFISFDFLFGQEQVAVFSHYHISPILISPAYAGFTDKHQLQMNIRSQWTGFPDSPKSYAIGYNGPIGKTLGAGASLMTETLGNQNRLRFQMNWAFRYAFKNVKLGMGFSTEFHTLKVANSVLENDLFIKNGGLEDEIANDAIEGNRVFDASLGFWSSFIENTFVGLTLSNLVVAKIGDIESGDPQGSFFRYIVATFGHEFEVEPYNFKLQPSVMVHRIKDKPFQVDFNMRGSFVNDKLIAGLSYRAGLGGAVGLLLGTNIDVFRLYYSYDVSFQNVQQYNGGTHEVTIAFDFGSGKKKFDR
jgi:type IX secretion system PorP/SprF family membrane protein